LSIQMIVSIISSLLYWIEIVARMVCVDEVFFLWIAGLVEVEHAIPDAAAGDVGSGVMYFD
jgi:hypothetical protein